ncbi:MAG: hypothetical protein J0L62_10575 [Bacteroidetes bacterium]|nr:hypothetical protein [Bacteroidota bacterium]
MYRLIVILILALVSESVFSQVRIHKHLNTENGLVQSQVAAIFEDDDGFLWFGTFGGLSRWNGYDFTNFQTQDGLVGNRISAIVQKKDGTLIFGIDGGGVSTFKNGKFDTLSIQSKLAGQSVTSLFLDTSENLYIGTFGDGIWILPTEGEVRHLTTKDGLSSDNIWCLVQDGTGTFWIGTDGGGLTEWRKDSFIHHQKGTGFGGDIVRSVLPMKNGAVWVGFMAGGLSVLRNDKWTSYSTQQGLAGNTVWSITSLNDDRLLICTDNGVSELKDGKFSSISIQNGLSAKEVYTVFRSKNETVYFGTSGGGVDIYQPGKLESYSKEIEESTILGVAEGPDGKMVLASYGNGVFVLDNGRFSKIGLSQGLPDLTVWSVSAGKSGTLYFSTSDGLGIYLAGKIKSIRKKDGLVHQRVYSSLEAHDGSVYIGTRKGVNILKNGKITQPESDFLKNTIIWSVKAGPDSSLFFCADGNGLVILKDGRYSSVGKKEGVRGDYIISALQASDGKLYIGTDGNGLTILDHGKAEYLDAKSGLTDNTIYNILEDKNQNIYLTTNMGINILVNKNGKRIIRTLMKSDGLVSNEQNLGSSFIASDGKIWFGTISGLSVYNPEKDKEPVFPPGMKLTGLMLYDQPVEKTENVSFSWDQNYLKFGFVGLDLPSPQKLTYTWQLSGVDKKPMTGKERLIQYTNLSPGTYTFEVVAVNEWGIKSDPVKSTFEIHPAWWKTWWFISLAVILFVLLVSWLIYNRVQQLLAVERLRAKLAADLHDNIGSSLTEIFYLTEFGNLSLKQNDTEAAAGNFTKIGHLSRALVKSMSDIVWLVNPSKDSLYDLIIRLKESYEDLFAASGVGFKTENIKVLESVHLSIEYRQNLFLIFKEAINNSLKYSQCTEIKLDADLSGKNLTLVLTDNGKGFNLSEETSGNGLKNIRSRAEDLKAKLEIVSVPGQGTVVKFEGRI